MKKLLVLLVLLFLAIVLLGIASDMITSIFSSLLPQTAGEVPAKGIELFQSLTGLGG